jgi:hypothetical protein
MTRFYRPVSCLESLSRLYRYMHRQSLINTRATQKKSSILGCLLWAGLSWRVEGATTVILGCSTLSTDCPLECLLVPFMSNSSLPASLYEGKIPLQPSWSVLLR